MDPFSFAVMTVAQIGIGFLFPSSGPRLKDLKVSGSTYGAVIPEAYGTVRVAGNLIWSDKIKEHKKKKVVSLKSYKYYVYTGTFAMACCKGPVTSIRKIWANHKLIYDADGGKLAIKKKFKITPFLGTEDQQPAGPILDIVGESNTPAYRGLCYVLFEDIPLEDFGNSIPQITVEVFASGEGEPRGTAAPAKPLSSTGAVQTNLNAVYSPVHDIMISVDPGTGTVRRTRPSVNQEEFHTVNPALAYPVGISPSTGNIIARPGLSNSEPFYMFEPFGLSMVAGFGRESGSTESFPTGIQQCAFSVTSDGVEYACFIGILGSWSTVPTYPLNLFTEILYKVFGEHSAGFYGSSHVVGVSGGKLPIFYIWEGGNSSGTRVSRLRLWRVSGGGAIPIYELANPDAGQAGVGFEAANIHYDAADGGVLVIWRQASKVFMAKVRDGVEIWRRQVAGPGATEYGGAEAINVGPTTLYGELWWVDDDPARLYRLDTLTGDWIRQTRDAWADYEDTTDIPQSVVDAGTAPYQPEPLYAPDGGPGQVSTAQMFFDPINRRFLGAVTGRAYPAFVIQPGLGINDVSLGGLVERILRRAGMSSDRFDVSDLYKQKLRGYGWASASDVKSILDQLRMLYLFDIYEKNGKLVGTLRESSTNEDAPGKPSRRIPQALLGSNGDGSGMNYWQETRLQEMDLPERVMLSYMNIDRDYETSTAVTKRISEPVPSMYSRQQIAMEMGVVMTATEAKNQVNKILWSQWGERTRHNTRVPWTYLDLDPADVVSVRMNDGRVFRERLHTLEFGADFGIDVEAYSQDEAAYISDAVADGGGAPPILTTPARPARPFIFNTPLLRDQDDTQGAYSLYYTGVAHGAPDDFTGAGLWRSVDSQSYGLLYGTDQDVEWAQVSGVVPPPRHGAFGLDWETKIVLWPVINWFDIESITDDELWAGANLCIVGDEVIQFRDAVQNVDGSWTISNLLRGRRGTEYACTTHKMGETFTFLAQTTIEGEGDTLDANGQARWFIGLGEGKALEEAVPVKLIYAPRDQMPYAPKDIRRSLSGSVVTLDWKRRTRMGGNMQDGTGGVPLHETSEQYEVYILRTPYVGDLSRGDEVPTADILYQTTTSESVVTFDVSGFTSPIDVNLDTLHVLIYQVSSAVGRGFPGVRSIEPWQDF